MVPKGGIRVLEKTRGAGEIEGRRKDGPAGRRSHAAWTKHAPNPPLARREGAKHQAQLLAQPKEGR